MKKTLIKSFFPLTAQVTQETINKADVYDPTNCIGAITLNDELKKRGIEDAYLTWGDCSGHVYPFYSEVFTVLSDKDMMDITEPTEVVFSLPGY